MKECKGLKQPRANPSLKDCVSKDSKQGISQMIMDSRKNLPCRKSDRQLKFRVLDRGAKENTIRFMCGKKEPDQEGDNERFDGKGDLLID